MLLAAPAGAQERTCLGGAPGAPSVYIDSSVSEVTVVTTDGHQLSAARNLLLCPGDEVQTGATGRVAIRFDEKRTVIRLDGNSRTRVLSGGTGTADASLLSGILYFVSSVRRHFEVDTPYIVAGIDGTEALVAVEPSKALAMAVVREGLVHSWDHAIGAAKTLAVAGGEAAFRSATVPFQSAPVGALPPPFRELLIASDSSVDWAVYYPPIMFAGDAQTPAVREAIRFLASGDYERAQAALAGATHVDPASTDALMTIIAVARNRLEEAKRWSSEAVEAGPQFAPAFVAASYYRQAIGDLSGALDLALGAEKIAPGDPYVVARVAELQMTIGDRRAALKSAERSLAIARTPLALFVAGLARLAAAQYGRAEALFNEAIDLDPEAPLPRLGLGLAYIRQGRTAAGTWEIERAVIHDPQRASLRTWLGRAYFDEELTAKATEELRLAKEADPQDPTPYLFSAIQLYAANRPIEALRELQEADRRGNARRVLRSARGLGEDAATRGAAEGRIYQSLGVDQLAIVKGGEAVSADPGNPGAHRFLSEADRARPAYEIAETSELLQSQLLSPPSKTPVQPQLAETNLQLLDTSGPSRVSFAEFSPLFDADGLRLDASGLAGTQSTFAEEIAVTGLYRNASLSVGQFHYQTDGYAENNDLKHDIYDAVGTFGTPEFTLFGEYRLRETESGDRNFDFDNIFSPDVRIDIRRDVARGGFHAAPSADTDVIGVYTWARLETEDSSDGDFGPLSGDAVDTANSGQVQHIFSGEGFRSVLGAAYIHNDRSDTTTILGSSDTTTGETDYANGYGYLYFEAPQRVTWTLGGSLADYSESDGGAETTEFLPKLGVVAEIVPGVVSLRAAYLRALKPDLVAEQVIEPTTVASFNQLYDAFNGTVLDQFGSGIDLTLGRLQVGGEFVRQNWEVPESGPSQDSTDNVFRAYSLLPLFDRVALSAGFVSENSSGDDAALYQEWHTNTVPLRLSYFDPSGLYGTVGYDIVDHHFRAGSEEGQDTFGIVNAAAGLRLPNERGLISVTVLNLLDESFHFENKVLRPQIAADPRYAPSRTVYVQASLKF